jgi:N-acetylmuramoyl-L-alanine amidase
MRDIVRGGHDPGAIGKAGLREAFVNLEVALSARNLLLAAGHRVVMTRDQNVFVTIGERVRRANEVEADVFVSIHCNGHESRSAHGTETFWHRRDKASRTLAEFLQHELVMQLGRRDRGVKEGAFQVIRTTQMPAALVELAFITNIEEEALLRDPHFRLKAATAILDGVAAMGQLTDENPL